MSLAERLGLAALNRLDPETAHGLALMALRTPFARGSGPHTSPALATELAGLKLPNPVGLAAGFDKNAEAIAELLNPPVLGKKINIPRGGYLVRRGRGRVVVERTQS